MKQIQHADEQLNRRSLFLRLRREIWIVPVLAVAGALAGALIYSLVWLSFSGQRQYRQISKYYLTFGKEENGEAADYYNDYTWNDLIWSIPAISDVIEADLPDGMTMDEAKSYVTAQILSDVRVLTIQVTAPEPEEVQQLTNALEDALVRYGKTAVQFDNIEYLSSGDVDAVVVSDRTRNAVLLGTVLGFLNGAVILWMRELLNDGIYVPEDALRRYGIPVLLVLEEQETQRGRRRGKRKTETRMPEFLQRETQEAEETLRNGVVQLIGEDEEVVRSAAERLQADAGITAGIGDAGIRKADHILCVISFGQANGTVTEHLMDRMRERKLSVEGIILMNADGAFLTAYYGRQKSKRTDRPA